MSGTVNRCWVDENTATLLPNGKVLIAGNSENDGLPADAEVYDPSTGTLTGIGHTISLMSFPRTQADASILFPMSDWISICDQLSRGRAHALRKRHPLFGPDGSLVVLAELISKDPGAERYTALFHRYDPPVADIPNENVTAVP